MRSLYTAGDCPVCESSGLIVPLRQSGSEQILFFCPLCGTAWTRIPDAHKVDEINALVDLAPNGVELLSPDEVDSLRASGLHLEATDYEPWAADLEPHIARGNSSSG